jgi:lipopolysaccharide/colanic/teichoic acid biosynthesis glycosyltransferase
MIRLLDLFFSVIALIVLLPLMIIIYLLIVTESMGGGFYNQRRVGKDGVIFYLHKFRTMYTGSDRAGLITVGKRDPRITRTGNFLRKTKLDELPQLINILKGEMSVVGPRPEVEKYVQMYNDEQRKILNVRPGLADITSIRFANEAEILGNQPDPEDYYIRVLMPQKLDMSLDYAQNPSLKKYFEVIGLTVKLIFNAR